MKALTIFKIFVWISTLILGSAAYSDVVTDWNTAALNVIRANRTPPPIASRALAILHASIYDAVNGISRTHEAYLVQSAVPASASKQAAASAAARKVLVSLFPMNAPSFDDLNATTLAAVRNGPQKSHGIAWGESVAGQILALRFNDGSDATMGPPSGSGWVLAADAAAVCSLFVAAVGLRHAVCHAGQPFVPPAGTACSW